MSKSKNTQKLSKLRRSDPFFERECQKYDFPLPSREFIIQTLAELGVPMPFAELVVAMDIQEVEREFFERRMFAMERDGQVMRNRRNAYLLPSKADLVRGTVQGHPDGYGFVVSDDEGADIFLGPNEMREVLHGDRVMVRVAGLDRRGRPEGKLVEVLERANTRIVGRVLVENGVTLVVPENRRISQEILLAPGAKSKAVAGQVVVVELVEQPTRYAQPIGKVVEVLGNYADPGMEIEIALRKHELPFEFSKAAKEQARRLPDKVRKMDWKGREDITALPLVTIDGETARDFDDAVFCEREGRGFRLVVAIADVSHYVSVGSALDSESYDRGNSVYFPRRVIPMLPEKISNGLCSLNPQVERLCMVCDMSLSQTGVIKQYRFYPAVMFSKARLTYNQVAAALYDKEPGALEIIGELLPHLQNLDKLFRVLLKARAKRGAIDFETQETRMVFDDNGKIEKIIPESRNDAHRLIEECMLAANVCASEFLQAHEQPALYRVHEGPTPEKLAKLREFLGEFGLQLPGGDEPKAADYAKLLEALKGRPDLQLLQTVMLRSLRQAVYSPDNLGHFGLAYEAYTHFTSPIRRYPDLLVHRAIKAVLTGQHYQPAQDAGDWSAIGVHCSMTERRADEADRDVENWLKCFYMRDRIGEEFDGSVSSVVPFGLFVALDDVFVEGLVHISDLGTDYFHFDDAHHTLVGERTGERYRLSDRIRVQLVRVNMEASKIDFRLIQGPQRATERVGKTARDKVAGAAVSPSPVATKPAAASRRRVVNAGEAVVPVRAEKPKAAKPKSSKAKVSKPSKAKTAKPRKSAVGGVKKKAKASV
ncbi:ribonuclease R [Zoogloea oleivorans]|uniref:Ribonuclease R n=2 Tax=Zoogloeaceae TaxID=2008794 RepID=A0A6C2CZ29_9RHOO|nr:ribonuclease R [Zoogloea oleivorans]TYC58954.1 ribonuclease R [Zoogloea oleivorans]